MRSSKAIVFLIIFFVITFGALVLFRFIYKKPLVPESTIVSSFKDCLSSGFETIQSFPRRICKAPDGRGFLESLTNQNGDIGIARMISPSSVSATRFPVTVEGEADESWFINGGFPVKIVLSENDSDTVASSGTASRSGEKNASGNVPFKAILKGTVKPGGKYYVALIKNDPEEKMQREAVIPYQINLVP